MNGKALWGRLALLGAAMIWGSSFFVMKNAVDGIPVFLLLAIRFTIGCALLSLVCVKKWRYCSRRLLWHCAVVGVLLFLAYTAQTYGLKDTTPGKNAFLTAVYCVLVPFVNWVLLRRRPSRWNWLAAAMCLGGIGLVSLDGSLSMNRGDALTMVGGVFYALHLVAVSRFGEEDDPVLLSGWQVSGLLDLGKAGRGDRHYDLHWGCWSLWYNLGSRQWAEAFLDGYGRDVIDPARLRLAGLIAAMDE